MATIPLAVVAALEDEVRDLRSRMSGQERLDLDAGRVTAGTWGPLPLLLVRTGMGSAAMERTITRTLQNFPARLCLHVGYGGAAVPELSPGDLIVATTLIYASRGLSFGVAPELVARAEKIRLQVGLPGRAGTLVTLDQVAKSPQEKAAHGRVHKVLAVDMESAALAGVCRAAGVPFLVVRAILDHLEYHLPDPVQRTSRKDPGQPREPQPCRNPVLSDLADRARRSLTAFTAAWLEEMAESWTGGAASTTP